VELAARNQGWFSSSTISTNLPSGEKPVTRKPRSSSWDVLGVGFVAVAVAFFDELHAVGLAGQRASFRLHGYLPRRIVPRRQRIGTSPDSFGARFVFSLAEFGRRTPQLSSSGAMTAGDP
jgi:hypothetical protein